MKTLIALLSLIFILGTGYLIATQSSPTDVAFANSKEKSKIDSLNLKFIDKSDIRLDSEMSEPSKTKRDGGNDGDPRVTPSRDEVLKEASRDPHSAPQSLIDFARSMGQPMHRALGNVTDAEALFPRLSECALDKLGTRTRTLKAYCLANAAIVAQAHATLSGAMLSLNEQAGSDVVSLASKLKPNSPSSDKE